MLGCHGSRGLVFVAAQFEGGSFIEGFDEFKSFLEGREVSIAFVGVEDVREEEFGAVGEEGFEDLGATDDEYGSGDVEGGEIGRGGDDFRPFGRSGEGAAEDEMPTAGEEAGEGLESLSAHEDRVIEGGPLEELQVFGEVPGEGAIAANDAIAGHGDDGFQLEEVSGQRSAVS